MPRLCTLVVALLAAPASLLAQTIGGTLPAPLPLLPPANWWNLDVSAAPVDATSGAFISFIGPTRGLHPDFGGLNLDDPTGTQIYGLPYVTVTRTQPMRAVTFVEYGDESDAGPYPIPDAARTQAHWIEGGWRGDDVVNADGDRHMLIVDTDAKRLYELYHLAYRNSRWEAGSGAIWDLRANTRRLEGWTSADAAGLAILPGLVRYDEVFPANGTDEIRHALRVTVRTTNGYVYPASHAAGSTSGALPMGARLRLKASKDISSYEPEVQRIFRAFKAYGLIVADNGSDMYISGTFDVRWDNDVLNPAFGSLKASDFEVVQRGWHPLDLQVTQTHTPEPPVPGQPFQYQVTVRNDDPDTQTGAGLAHDVVLTDTLPAGVTYQSATGASCNLAGATLTCPLGDLAPSTEVMPTIQVLPTSGGTLTNTAQVSGGETDPLPANNTSVDTSTAGPLRQLSVGDASVTEGDAGDTPLVFQLTLSEAAAGVVTVHYATADGTATGLDGDFSATSGSLSFAPGTTSATLEVLVQGDTRNEGDETLIVNLSAPSGAAIVDGQAIGTILDDDPPPSLAVGEVALAEGQIGFATALVAVTLSAPSGRTVTVAYSTADGTANAGTDYVAASGTLSFRPGATLHTLELRVLGEGLAEADETFSLVLSNPQDASIGTGTGTVTILDDDALPSLLIGDVTLSEGTGGVRPALFPVTLSQPAAGPVTLTWSTAAGTARAGLDYTAASGLLSFAPGQTTQTASVSVRGDRLREANEAFLVRLANPAGATLADAEAQATILDDDGPGAVCLPILSVPFTIAASGRYCLLRDVVYALADGAAITVASDDVTLDLGRHTLQGNADTGTRAYGVFAQDRRGLTIRGGTVRGFFVAVFLGQSAPHSVPQRNSIASLRVADSAFCGIHLQGTGTQVVLSTLTRTGGTTDLGPDADVFGILVEGASPRLYRNQIWGFAATGGGVAFGVGLDGAAGARVLMNTVGNPVASPATGVRATASAAVVVQGNRFFHLARGIVFQAGASGTHAGNTFYDVTTPYLGP